MHEYKLIKLIENSVKNLWKNPYWRNVFFVFIILVIIDYICFKYIRVFFKDVLMLGIQLFITAVVFHIGLERQRKLHDVEQTNCQNYVKYRELIKYIETQSDIWILAYKLSVPYKRPDKIGQFYSIDTFLSIFKYLDTNSGVIHIWPKMNWNQYLCLKYKQFQKETEHLLKTYPDIYDVLTTVNNFWQFIITVLKSRPNEHLLPNIPENFTTSYCKIINTLTIKLDELHTNLQNAGLVSNDLNIKAIHDLFTQKDDRYCPNKKILPCTINNDSNKKDCEAFIKTLNLPKKQYLWAKIEPEML